MYFYSQFDEEDGNQVQVGIIFIWNVFERMFWHKSDKLLPFSYNFVTIHPESPGKQMFEPTNAKYVSSMVFHKFRQTMNFAARLLCLNSPMKSKVTFIKSSIAEIIIFLYKYWWELVWKSRHLRWLCWVKISYLLQNEGKCIQEVHIFKIPVSDQAYRPPSPRCYGSIL